MIQQKRKITWSVLFSLDEISKFSKRQSRIFLKFSFHLHSGLLPAFINSVKSFIDFSFSFIKMVLDLFDNDAITKLIFGKLAIDEVVVDDDVTAPSES